MGVLEQGNHSTGAMLPALPPLLAVLATASAITDQDLINLPQGQFPYHVQLHPRYALHWAFNHEGIMFEAVVQTKGYLALGVSANGGMFPADVAVAFIDDHGTPYLIDGYTTAHQQPSQDAHQDLHLLSAKRDGDMLTFRWWRKLETCDKDDRAIKEGTTKIIWSLSDSIPHNDSGHDTMAYHGTTRGTKSLLLLDPPTDESDKAPLTGTITTLNFTNANVSVPARDTYYNCRTFKMPDLGGKRHMVRYEPIIQPGHENLVHHMLLYYCSQPMDADANDDLTYDCNHSKPPQLRSCYSTMIAWAIGGKAFNFPPHVGYSLGTADDPGFFVLETHYDNPQIRSDYIDDSGLRLILSSDIRQYDAGTLELGMTVTDHLVVPALTPAFTARGYCSEFCLKEALGDQEIHVFANTLHSHLAGRKLRTRIVRKGHELPPLAQDNNYDFNYQEARSLHNETTIRAGDAFIVECEYENPHTTNIYGGLKTTDEMCLSFAMYYPRQPVTLCASEYNYHIPSNFGSVRQYVDSVDWTQQSAHDAFLNITDHVGIEMVCHGTKYFNSNRKFYSDQRPVTPTVAYQAPQVCPSQP